jgi:hypothetical protein
MDYILGEKKGEQNFHCMVCDHNTSDKWKFERHLLTAKHRKLTDGLHFGGKKGEKLKQKIETTNHNNMCECGKVYKNRQGLWKHKKNCNNLNESQSKEDNKPETEPVILFKNHQELIQTILQDNQDFKQMLIEQNNKIMELASKNTMVTNNTTNNTNNTTNNNFNLSVFLNVECKDALNIMDFVDSLQVKIQDLEETGRIGYINGISRIFINGLNDLDVNKRPIHCSDFKREIIYIKDKDSWEKETDDRNKLKQAIRTITTKNIKQISLWQKENPDYQDSSSKTNDKYLKIVSNSMNGSTVEETQKNFDKIISKVAKEVIIQKD